MLLQRKVIGFILAGVCLILLGMYSKNIFAYAPTIGWLGGLLCMMVATFFVLNKPSTSSK
ncbi:hypothetical protein QCD85_06400 [Paenibacillus sp. PsM32]|uniref:Uncharacterized protein n=1 Tax=Paenibacillus kyungheensis TaxID=1452732 RepID=A0AAX3LVY7_9BACL|nr:MULTISPECIES: hypothetical protein [Paenibacillus]MDN4617720.1 hypothetical protein [Paenibacillus sp. PsM32]WCT54056.1 hypothetical protein PQ456_12655 [Paenibacillus kyungheensis]